MDYMKRAIDLARERLGVTSPNPAVGAVVVRDGVVVGEGSTQPAGSWHAEMVALQQAGEKARGATMYVSLEPCRHYGRTPPCTSAIIAAGVAEVHVATVDPNPLVAGRGLQDLTEAGIRAVLGEREEEAREIIEAHAKYITTGLPFVVAKFGESLDGKIATHTGSSYWVTGDESRQHFHSVRARVDAIMVGINTLIADNPQLTARPGGEPQSRQPLKVIVDGKARTPTTALALKPPGKALIAVTEDAPRDAVAALRRAGAQVAAFSSYEGRVDLLELMRELGRREITNVLVEGGGEVHGSLFDRGLVDKVMAYVAPVIIGGDKAVPAVGGRGAPTMDTAYRLTRVKVERLGDDVLVVGYVTRTGESKR